MFGLFKKKNKAARPNYQVFSSEVNKYRHIIKLIKSASGPITVLYHFNNTRTEAEQLLKAAGIDFSDNNSGNIQLMFAQDYIDSLSVNSNPVIVTEIYPLPDRDIELMQKSNGLDRQFFSAMDSPFFNKLGSYRLPTLMQNLGMQDDEAISHPMVSKSIAKVQDKLQKEVLPYL